MVKMRTSGSTLLSLFFFLFFLNACNNDGKKPDETGSNDSTTADSNKKADVKVSAVKRNSLIEISVHDLDISMAMYQKIGFTELASGDDPFPYKLISDNSAVLMLSKRKETGMALIWIIPELEAKKAELEQLGLKVLTEPAQGGKLKMISAESPEGITIRFVTGLNEFELPATVTMIDIPMEQIMAFTDYPNKKIGMLGEYCVNVKSLDDAMEWWKKLGFESKSKMSFPYPWAILSDGQHLLGLHQTEEWTGEHITYFAKGQAENIKKLKADGLEGLEDLKTSMGPMPGNATLKTTEGNSMFLFSF